MPDQILHAIWRSLYWVVAAIAYGCVILALAEVIHT